MSDDNAEFEQLAKTHGLSARQARIMVEQFERMRDTRSREYFAPIADVTPDQAMRAFDLYGPKPVKAKRAKPRLFR
tara:strand:- start:15 stop:242 length:228 start_codon:yes stop_codon:yes gene_type:complete